MSGAEELRIAYGDHETVREVIDVVTYSLEGISLAFDAWDEPQVRGPGLYVVIVAGTTVADYADPMGGNRWPVAECPTVTDDLDAFYDAAQDVAYACDGAVVVSVDGNVLEQMVRMKDLTDEERAAAGDGLSYADWMGARHMSALDTSVREEVVAAVTLSEESGRVTRFVDGAYDDAPRESLGGPWRPEN
ncbi:MAG: hypothetical protein ABEH47_04560 [Haloferacaceae archaeon]